MAMASPCMSSRKLHKPLLKQSRSVGDNVQIENNLSRSKRYLESVVKKNYTHIIGQAKYNSINHIFLYEKILKVLSIVSEGFEKIFSLSLYKIALYYVLT